MLPSGAHRRPGRTALVLVQLIVFVTYLFGPTAALGQDPTPEPTAAESPTEEPTTDPTPSTEPEAQAEPSTEPEAQAEPSTDPDSSTQPEPSTDPKPSASPDPSPEAEPNTEAVDPDTLPWIGSDRDDYPPGSFVRLPSGNWQPGETVHILVNDDIGSTWTRSVTATADEFGLFMDEFYLPNWFVAEFSVRATGEVSGTVRHSFLDSIAAASSQTAAGTGAVTVNAPTGLAANDVIVAQVTAVDVGGTIGNRNICPGNLGWTRSIKTHHNDGGKVLQEIFWRRVGVAAEPASFTFYFRNGNCQGDGVTTVDTGSNQGRGMLAGVSRFTGVIDTGNPIAVTAAQQGPSATTATAPAVTTTSGHGTTRIIRYVGVFKNTDITHASVPRIYHRQAASTERAFAAFDSGDQAPGAGTSFNASIASSGEWLAQTIALREAAGATKLAFTTLAHTGAVNACLGPITVQTQNASNVATNPTTATEVSLASDGTGSFFSDAACATALTAANRTIGTSANSFSFYYKATARGDGTHLLTASATGLTSATQTQTIEKAPQAITFTSTAPSGAVFDDTYTPTATGGASGNAVTFGASGACSYSSGTVTMTGTGTCTVAADQAGNDDYLAAPQASQSFTVGPKPVTVTPDAGQTKVYGEGDPPLTYTLSEAIAVSGALDRVSGEDVGLYEITLGTLTSDSTNHTLVLDATTVNFEITARPITVTADAGQSKVYGQADPLPFTYTVSDGPLQGDDEFSGALDRAAGEDVGLYAITLGTLAIDDGNNGDNYTLTFVSNGFEITPKGITGNFITEDKVYDDTTHAAVLTRTLNDVEFGDDVELVGGTAAFADHNVGTWTVTLSGATLDGADAGNYTLLSVATETADITARPLTISAVSDSKTYDATTDSDETPTVSGLQGDDSVTDLDQAFQSRHVMGTDGSTLAVTDYTVNDENGGANYSVTTETAPGTINPATLTINAVTDTKTYDGTTTSDETPEVVGLLGTDAVTDRDQAFVSEDVMGTDASTLVVTGYTVNDGNGGSNYTVSTNDATGTITQLGITGSFTAANKFWDGTTAATVTSRSLPGVIGLDDVDLVDGTATFASSAIGTWSVTLTGASVTGADAGNYTLTSVSDAMASILAAYRSEGFFRPVDMTPTTSHMKMWNVIKGGQTVPLKFRVYSAETGEEITSTAGLTVRITKIQCSSGVLEADDIAPATGSTSLRYSDGQFIFNWATPKGANICYEAYVQTADGATQMAGPGGTPLHDAFFRSK